MTDCRTAMEIAANQPPPRHRLVMPIMNAMYRHHRRNTRGPFGLDDSFEILVREVRDILVSDDPGRVGPLMDARIIVNRFASVPNVDHYLMNVRTPELLDYADEVLSAILWGNTEFSEGFVHFAHPIPHPRDSEPPRTGPNHPSYYAIREMQERTGLTDEELFKHNFREMLGGRNVSIPSGVGFPTAPIEMPDAWDEFWKMWFGQ